MKRKALTHDGAQRIIGDMTLQTVGNLDLVLLVQVVGANLGNKLGITTDPYKGQPLYMWHKNGKEQDLSQ